MDNDGKGILGNPKATAEEIRQAWEFAALAAMQEHVKNGEPVVTWDWETNQVMLVPAEKFAAPELSSTASKAVQDINK
jgi:hypothetical protein